jgi:hypothetical protein
MAASGGSAAGLLHLLQLAGSMGESAAREQLHGAMLDMLLCGGAAGLAASVAPAPAEAALLLNLTAVLRQCSSRAQVVQLRQEVQDAVAARAAAARSSRLGGGSAAAATEAVSGAVQLSYQRLHVLCSGFLAADPAAAGAGADSLQAVGAALFVLGPFSSSYMSDAETCAAEAGLLLAAIRQLTAAAATVDSCSNANAGDWKWLLASLALGLRQLTAACSEHSSSSQDAGQPADAMQQHGGKEAAVHALAQAALPALQALLLSPACTDAVRQGALKAVLALPPCTQAPLRLLRWLGAAAASSSEPTAEEAAQMCLNPDAEGDLQLVAATGIQHSPAAAGGVATRPEAPAAGIRQQQVQQRALLALLELLGGMAGGCEQQRAAFLQELQAGEGGHHQQQDQRHVSKAGRPLRPAAEWWVGGGQQQAGEHPPPGSAAAAGDTAAAAPGAASSAAYMQAEDEAAKQEAAAQRFLDSLLAAADTAPACYLPLLERLAGGQLGSAALPAVKVSSCWRLMNLFLKCRGASQYG